MPGNVLQLFGGNPDIVPLLDGEAHHRRKELLLHAFSREAIASYLPRLQLSIETLLGRLAARGEGPVTADLKALAIEAVTGCVMGVAPGPDLDALLADYSLILQAASALPIPLPGTAYSAGLAARDRILTRLAAIVAAHQEAAGVGAATSNDGLSRILAARAADGSQLTAGQAAREMHHFVLAGVIVFGELVATLLQLDRNPQVRDRLAAEVVAASPSGPVTPAALRMMPVLDHVVMELKRLTPIVAISFGRAKQDLSLRGFVIPRGWLLLVGVGESNRTALYTEPDKFDPERFSDERAEQNRHRHAFTPQGAGNLTEHHKCAGYDFSTVVMQLFAVLLLRGYKWSVPAQELAMNHKAIPPEHKSGLVVRLTKL